MQRHTEASYDHSGSCPTFFNHTLAFRKKIEWLSVLVSPAGYSLNLVENHMYSKKTKVVRQFYQTQA